MFVVDASALAKAVLDEPRSDALRAWLEEALTTGARLIGPPLLASEMARVIQKERLGSTLQEMRELWRAVLAGVSIVDFDPEPAWDITGLTFYDAEYVSLAKSRGATLVTADGKQARAARAEGVAVVDFVP